MFNTLKIRLGMSFTVRPAWSDHTCGWCDGDVPATFAVTDGGGWTDYACDWHMRNMYGEVKLPRLRRWANQPAR